MDTFRRRRPLPARLALTINPLMLIGLAVVAHLLGAGRGAGREITAPGALHPTTRAALRICALTDPQTREWDVETEQAGSMGRSLTTVDSTCPAEFLHLRTVWDAETGALLRVSRTRPVGHVHPQQKACIPTAAAAHWKSALAPFFAPTGYHGRPTEAPISSEPYNDNWEVVWAGPSGRLSIVVERASGALVLAQVRPQASTNPTRGRAGNRRAG